MKIFASFIMFLLLLDGFSTTQTLIQDFCKKAAAKDTNLKYDFCVNSLQEDPQSKAATSLKGLVLASISTAAGQTTHVTGIIIQILKEVKYGKDILKSLSHCLGYLDYALDHFDETLASIKSLDYRSANVHLNAALDEPTTCDDGFKKIKQWNPIANETNVLYQKILIPFALSKML